MDTAEGVYVTGRGGGGPATLAKDETFTRRVLESLSELRSKLVDARGDLQMASDRNLGAPPQGNSGAGDRPSPYGRFAEVEVALEDVHTLANIIGDLARSTNSRF